MIHNRHSIRLKGYDYSQEGLYYITICTQGKLFLFGDIIKGKMKLNEAGKMIEQQWINISNRFPNVELDEFVIMPNHVHGIIIINACKERAGTRPAPTISNIIGAFKSITTNEYIHGVKNFDWPVFHQKIWQRNFYEQIIRDIVSLGTIRGYIKDNPVNWGKDTLFIKVGK